MRSALAVGVSAVAGLFFFLNLDLYFFEASGWASPPLHYILALAAVSLLLVDRAPLLLRSPAWQALLAFALLGLAAFVWSEGSEDSWQAVEDTVLALVFLSGWLLLLSEPAAVRTLSRVLVVGLVAGASLCFLEVFHPQAISNSLGRTAGFYLNPNFCAQALVAGLALVLFRCRRLLPAVLLICLVGAAVLTTFSRGGILMCVLVVGAFLAVVARRRPVPAMASTGAIACAALAAFVLLPDQLLQAAEASQRLETLSGRGVEDAAGRTRLELVSRSLERIPEKPVLGHGPGAARELRVGARELGPHNQYLEVAVDFGAVGLVILLAFYLRTLRGGLWPVGLFLAGNSLFFHGMLLNRQVLLVVALAEALRVATPDSRSQEVGP